MCPQSCSTSSVEETKKTNITEEDGIFVHPSKHHQNLPDILPNNPSLTCEITILGSLHPHLQVDHRNIHIPSIERTSQRLK